MTINWKIRFRNPVFWAQIVLAVILPVLAYFGMAAEDLTSWPLVWRTLKAAALNPYVCVMVLASVWNAVNDPTTVGLSDSTRAMGYTARHREGD